MLTCPACGDRLGANEIMYRNGKVVGHEAHYVQGVVPGCDFRQSLWLRFLRWLAQ